jgi:hypothetical protein
MPETERHGAEQLRAREARVLSLLLAGRTLGEICAAIPISRTALWRVRTRPRFEEAFRAARSELLAVVVDKLRSDAADFADVLHGIATDTKLPGSHRVAASREGLAAMFKGIEVAEIEQRLTRLEGIAGGEK